MDSITVATAQQQMRLFDSPDDHRRELARFMQVAAAKGAQIVVFPALSGVLAASPLLAGFRMRLLKRAGGGRRQTSLLDRTRKALAGSTADLLKASFRQPYDALLAAEPEAVAGAHAAIFQELAKTYSMTVVAGSAYLPAEDGTFRHSALLFGPDGALLGRHDAVLLAPVEETRIQPGRGWSAIETSIGRIGVLFGGEVLYPEVGRGLMGQGVELLAVVCATSDDVFAAEVRLAAVARAQENRCFALTSFAVGPDYLAAHEDGAAVLAGRSGIYAPLELTPRYSGALVEMGAGGAEGLLTVELNGPALADLRERQPLRLDRVAALASSDTALPSPEEGEMGAQELLETGD